MVWEYTGDTTGSASTTKEEAPGETAAKKGQVCSPLLVTPLMSLAFVVLCISLSPCLLCFHDPFCLHCLGFGNRVLTLFPRLTLELNM